MIQSMTAFASTQKKIGSIQLTWEIRSVNHRYLDLALRVPDFLRYAENQLRSIVNTKVSRGRIECQLKYRDDNSFKTSRINEFLIKSLIETGHTLASSYVLPNDLSVSKILAMPGVFDHDIVHDDNLNKECISLFSTAIDGLIRVRTSEGHALNQFIKQRLDELLIHAHDAHQYSAIQKLALRDKLLNRLHSLNFEIPDSRIDHEIAILITRMDVSEELDRLQIHSTEVRRIIEHDKIAGRRLDFLMQELIREVNTICSKSDSAELTQCAVEMKVIIEQIREQIQNIE